MSAVWQSVKNGRTVTNSDSIAMVFSDEEVADSRIILSPHEAQAELAGEPMDSIQTFLAGRSTNLPAVARDPDCASLQHHVPKKRLSAGFDAVGCESSRLTSVQAQSRLPGAARP